MILTLSYDSEIISPRFLSNLCNYQAESRHYSATVFKLFNRHTQTHKNTPLPHICMC